MLLLSCVLNWPVLSCFRLFVVILRLFNLCLLNLFIYAVLRYHIGYDGEIKLYIMCCEYAENELQRQ